MHGRQGQIRQAMYQERKSKRLEEKQQRGVYSRQLAREKRRVTGKGSGKNFERQAKGEHDRKEERETRNMAGKGVASILGDR